MQQEQRAQGGNENSSRIQQGEKFQRPTTVAICVWLFVAFSVFFWGWLRVQIPIQSEYIKIGVESMFNIAIVILVVLQTRLYFRQSKALDAQVTAMENSVIKTDDIIGKMQEQLGLEKQQVEIAARQVNLWLERERAYIFIRRMTPTGLDVRTGPDGTGAVSVKITFRNGGHTSAFGFRANANVEVGDSPRQFEWAEVASPVRQFFIPEREDRSVYIDAVVDTRSVFRKEKFLFVDGQARYSTLGGDRILCFGATWNEDKEEFSVRYQHEQIDLMIQDSIHGHMADNVTLVQRSKPEPNEGNKNGKNNKDEAN